MCARAIHLPGGLSSSIAIWTAALPPSFPAITVLTKNDVRWLSWRRAREPASLCWRASLAPRSQSTAVCKGNYCVIGSDERKAAGIEDDVELFVQDALAYGVDDDALPGNKEEVIRLYAGKNSLECYDLLKELGVEFSAPYMLAGHSVFRVHRVDNADMQSRVTAAAQEAGANFLFNTEFEGSSCVDATGHSAGELSPAMGARPSP